MDNAYIYTCIYIMDILYRLVYNNDHTVLLYYNNSNNNYYYDRENHSSIINKNENVMH